MDTITKSGYTRGSRCPKMIWLRKNRPELFDKNVLSRLGFESGLQTETVAEWLFGGDPSMSVSREFICEGFSASVDLFREKADGSAEFYEVKGAARVTEEYIENAAYQYFVLTSCGYRISKAGVIHLNTDYVRKGALDVDALLTVVDVTEKCRACQERIRRDADLLRETLELPEEPSREISTCCFSPNQCGYFSYCSGDLPHPNVFDLANTQLDTKLELYREGKVRFSEILGDPRLKGGTRLQVEKEVLGGPDLVDVPAIRDFLKTLSYPLYFLDFEAFQPAIPLYEGTRPFEQIVFQYSLHYVKHAGGRLMHKEFLAYPGKDPRRELAECLIRDLPQDACTIAYNKSYECSRIAELANLFPDLHDRLMNIHDHVADIMTPFRKKQYYNRAMQGSYSIKYVLPALFPADPSLDYHSLTGVQNGAEASLLYNKMGRMEPGELEKCRADLLKYCSLDTLAMVKLWQKLTEAAGEE